MKITELFFETPNIVGDRCYGVIFNYPKQEIRITQKIATNLVHHDRITKTNTFFITKEQVYINKNVPSNTFAEITDKLGKIIYPIQFVKNQSKVFTVSNHKEIKERCKNIKVEILDYYEGSMVDELLENFEETISVIQNIELTLQKDLFLQFLYLPIYRFYNLDRVSNFQYDFWIEDKKIDFEFNSIISDNYTQNGKIAVQVQSDKNQNFAIKATYFLNPEFYFISGIEAEIHTENDTIQFECYLLE